MKPITIQYSKHSSSIDICRNNKHVDSTLRQTRRIQTCTILTKQLYDNDNKARRHEELQPVHRTKHSNMFTGIEFTGTAKYTIEHMRCLMFSIFT